MITSMNGIVLIMTSSLTSHASTRFTTILRGTTILEGKDEVIVWT
jgi:hypothetical protein